MSPIGRPTMVQGFVTQRKFLAGRTVRDLERLIGFHFGRLAQGALFAYPIRLPTLQEFETAGYSQVAGHRHVAPRDLDPVGLRRLAMQTWATQGPDGLVKVLPTTRHSATMADDDQYPPGEGIPQWRIICAIPGTIVATVSRYDEIVTLAG